MAHLDPAAPRDAVRAPRTPFGLRRQLALLLPLLVTWAGAAVVLAVAGTQPWTPLKQLFLDASYLGGQPWYSGVLNEAGLVSWSVAVAAAGLGSWVAALAGRRRAARFLGFGAVVVALMLVDVWIQFHSSVAPRLGLDSNVAQLLLAAAGATWFGVFLPEIARTRWLVLVCSGVFLGFSAGIDTVLEPTGVTGLLLEDGNRLLGILTLTHYLVITTVDIIRSVVGERTAAADAARQESAAMSTAVLAALGTPPRDLPSAAEAAPVTALTASLPRPRRAVRDAGNQAGRR